MNQHIKCSLVGRSSSNKYKELFIKFNIVELLNFWAFLILDILVWREARKCSVRKTMFFLNSIAYQTCLSLLATSRNEIARKKRNGILFNIWKWSTNTFHLIQTQCAQFRLLFTL